jgi:diguanylate cyclase (GGDEF)-like protein
MGYGRSKMLGNGDRRPDPAPLRNTLRNRSDEQREISDEQREIDALRSTNAHLMRELAALKEREAQAQQLADRDGLTGLFNRRRMQQLLETSIAVAAQFYQCVGVLFIDLNGFKGINDEYGHAAGDKILTTVSARIASRVRAGDIVCRYGGDEFVVLLPQVSDAAAVSAVADMIRERVALPYWLDGHEQHLTAAIGEAIYPHDGTHAEALLQRADQAMYRLKNRASRPMVSLGARTPERPARRHGDKSKASAERDHSRRS